MIRNIIPLAIVALFLAACGGGGGSDPHTTTSPLVAPPDSATSLSAAPERARKMAIAAAVAASAPAPDADEVLPVTPGANVVINEIQMFLGLNKTPGGKFFGLSDQSGTHLVDPATVKEACFNSFETGWTVPGHTSRACAPVAPETGYAELPINATCNRALGTWSVVLNDGTVLWADTEGERAWTTEGLPVIRHTGTDDPLRGLIEYGAGGRQQPFATSTAVKDGKVELTVNFGSNCLGGFGLDEKLTNLMPAEKTYFKFGWNSPKAGADGGEGWGIVPVGDRMPSVVESYAEYDTEAGSYTLTFKGLACGDRGNITVYQGTGETPETVVWDPGVDAKGVIGFGAGWFAIQRDPDELQLWVAKAPVSFDRDKYQIVLPGC